MSHCFVTTASPFEIEGCSYINSPQGSITITDCSTEEKTILKVIPITHADIRTLTALLPLEKPWQKRLSNCANLHTLGFPWSCYVIYCDDASPTKESALELAFLQSDPHSPGNLVFETKTFSSTQKIQALFMLAAWKWIKHELLPKMIKGRVHIPIFDNEGQFIEFATPQLATIRTTFLLGEDLMEKTMQNENFVLKHPRTYSMEVARAMPLETISEEPTEEEKKVSKLCCAIL